MPRLESAPAMRVGRHLAQRLLLRTGSGERSEPGADAAPGRIESGTSVVWQPAVDRLAAKRRPTGQPQADGPPTGVDGSGSGLSQTQPEPTGRRAPDLSLPLGRAGNHGSGPDSIR